MTSCSNIWSGLRPDGKLGLAGRSLNGQKRSTHHSAILGLLFPVLAFALACCSPPPMEPRTGNFPVGICGRRDELRPVLDANYIVFFGPGSDTVPLRGTQVLQEMLETRQRFGGDGSVIVVGHVDGAEAKSTRGLDLRRAVAVRDILTGLGANPRAVAMVPRMDRSRKIGTCRSCWKDLARIKPQKTGALVQTG